MRPANAYAMIQVERPAEYRITQSFGSSAYNREERSRAVDQTGVFGCSRVPGILSEPVLRPVESTTSRCLNKTKFEKPPAEEKKNARDNKRDEGRPKVLLAKGEVAGHAHLIDLQIFIVNCEPWYPCSAEPS
jgi:hypothetical protein